MRWHHYGDFAPYVPVAARIAQGRAAAKELATKEGRSPDPVKIQGRKIAKTFWGMKWCENLERYRDFANRLPRGATYVRNGSVADLVIEPGRVRAIVGGSEAYTVEIKIKTLLPAVWTAIGQDCAREIESLFDLLQGKFSDGVMTRLTRAEDGLFPRPGEISLSCTCPDSAGVCKHIAATMYGVGSRLDIRPELLFTLRQVDHLELIGHAASSSSLDQSLGAADGMALSDGELGDIFGIELESSTNEDAGKKPSRTGARKKPAPKALVQTVPPEVTEKKNKASVTSAVRKRRATTNVVVAESKKPSPRKATASAKATAHKPIVESSVRGAKAKTPSKSAAIKAGTVTTAKPGATRTKKSPVQTPVKQPAPPRRTK